MKYLPILIPLGLCFALTTRAAEPPATDQPSTGSISAGAAPLGNSASMNVTATPATPAPEQPKAIAPAGHVELFNGKDFTGWVLTMRGNANPTDTWSIEDGLIKCTGKPNGYARTAQAYRDYVVTVEWRFPPGKQGNTGVLVNMNLPDVMTPWPKCVECQGLHAHQGDFWFWSGSSCKELTTLPAAQLQGRTTPKNGIIRPAPDAEKPVGEWNTFTVVCAGDTVKILVNDKEVDQITGCNVSSGFIGLQSEGAGLEIRKVSLDPLPK